jgi:hypothetical protein
VEARFVCIKVDKSLLSKEYILELLPAIIPEVKIADFEPRAPADIMQRKSVLECHSVDSHAVCPALPAEVKTTPSTRPAPNTVTDADPVTPLLYPEIVLTVAISAENAADALLTRSPAVTITLRVFPSTRAEKALTVESEIHSVTSQLVCPTRMCDVSVMCPNPAPCIVIDVEPDPTVFRF